MSENKAINTELLLKKALLTQYSVWLEKKGYIDSDWWSEEPCTVDQFLKELNHE
jgi:hypothetical protein